MYPDEVRTLTAWDKVINNEAKTVAVSNWNLMLMVVESLLVLLVPKKKIKLMDKHRFQLGSCYTIFISPLIPSLF